MDEVGKIVREVKVASEPEALLAVLKNPAYLCCRETTLRAISNTSHRNKMFCQLIAFSARAAK